MLRFSIIASLALVAVLTSIAVAVGSIAWLVLAVVIVGLFGVAIFDVVQTKHSILSNYPVIGHMRFVMEFIRPEMQQYFVERDFDGRPFPRETRSIIYERAKGIHGDAAYGTQHDVYEEGYEYLVHTTAPTKIPDRPHRVRIGGPDCTRPYDMSLLNVSAMSFGAISGNAILALNKGAKLGGFAHDTGEGGISKYHPEHGGDLVWQIGSGYFGARTKDSDFDLVSRLVQGADYTNAARPMMMATGCIQSLRCHTNECPVGVATQDPRRARALDVGDKSQRVFRYHDATVEEACQILSTMGVNSPDELRPHLLRRMIGHTDIRSYADLYEWLEPGQLLQEALESWAADWVRADPDRFRP